MRDLPSLHTLAFVAAGALAATTLLHCEDEELPGPAGESLYGGYGGVVGSYGGYGGYGGNRGAGTGTSP